MTHRAPINIALALIAIWGPPALAQKGGSEAVKLGGIPGGDARIAGTVIFPVEDVLDSLRQSLGFSFIFDSGVVAGKSIPRIERALSPEAALRDELDAVNLRLHKVAPNTFAITEMRDTLADSAAVADSLYASDLPLDTILVMGSAPMAGAMTGSKHIFTIDADDLAYLSATSPAEAIYDLPQSLASFTPSNTALYGATAGISLADLRGLQPRRTMVLVNGRRRTMTTGGNGAIGGVDLNSVAEPFLERIEVQNLPGGARYGGAAVAGTINFVTKSGLNGVEAGARAGISERGDSEEISIHALAGRSLGSAGNLTVGLNVTRNEGIIGADREFSAVPYGFGLNGVRARPFNGVFSPGFGGSSYTGRGLVGGVILNDGAFAPLPDSYVPNTDGTVSPFVASLDQLFNWAAWQHVVLPNDRILGLASFTGDIADWRVFAEAQAGLSATDNSIAPLLGTRGQGIDRLIGDAAVIPLGNPTLPQSIRDLALTNYGASAQGVVFEHRYVELGPRRHAIDRRYIDIAAGVETGDIDSGNFSLAYRFSHNRVVSRDFDRIDRNRLDIALDPALCAATPGCALVDYFSAPEIAGAALDFIVIPEIRRTIAIEEHEITAAASRVIPFSDDFEGKIAAGVELRRAILSDRDQIPAGTAPIARLPGADNRGAVNSIEAYAEFETPLWKSNGFPGQLDGSLALRTAKSSQFDYSMNFEGGLDWRPVDGVAFFTRQQIGERTPDLIELFAIGSTLEMFFEDPCGAVKQSAAVQANCASAGPLGVGPGFVQTASLASMTFYGNPELDAEKIRTSVFGATLSPTEIFTRIPGRMQITATWLDYRIEQAISGIGDALGGCFESAGLSDPSCGVNPRTGAPAIVRDPVTRQVVSIDSVLRNSGSLNWRGLDLELRYAAHPDRLGLDAIWMSALHTYTERADSDDGSRVITRMAGLTAFPRHRTLLSAGAEAGRWSFVGYANRRGRVVTARNGHPDAEVPAALYLDATIRFDVTDQAYVQASVQNITDKEPAITAFNDIGNFAPEYYDPVGRRYALSVRLSF